MIHEHYNTWFYIRQLADHQQMDIKIVVGWNLRRLRVDQGLSQDDLALEAELERAYIGHIERGSKNPTVVTLDKLAKTLNSEITDFFYKPDTGLYKVETLKGGRNKK